MHKSFKNIQAKIDMALYASLKNMSQIEEKSIKEIMKNCYGFSTKSIILPLGRKFCLVERW